MQERVQKILSDCGICSRRAAEKLMEQGIVTVNGTSVLPGAKADRSVDQIAVDGKLVADSGEKIYLMLNKPRGYVTTVSDEKGRETVMKFVADCGARVYPVGRLDMDSEGLLLLTNDGNLTQGLLHPSGEVNKTYYVWVTGDIKAALPKLQNMIEIGGEKICAPDVQLLGEEKGISVFSITIHEGKNRQIRRMCDSVDLSVKRLRRVREGGIELGDLELGKWRHLTENELQLLKKEAGI